MTGSAGSAETVKSAKTAGSVIITESVKLNGRTERADDRDKFLSKPSGLNSEVLADTATATPTTATPKRGYLFVDKYRPQALHHVLGHEKAKAELLRWFTQDRSASPVLLSGATGIGKTSLAHTFILSRNLVLRDVRSLPGDFLETFNQLLYDARCASTGIVVDEVDNMDAGERTKMLAVLKERYRKPQPPPVVICVCTDHHDKSLQSLKTFSTLVSMYKPFGDVNKDVRLLLKRTAAEENMSLSASAMKHIETTSNGDFRSALNMMQLGKKRKASVNSVATRETSAKSRETSANSASSMDTFVTPFEGANRVLTTSTTTVTESESVEEIVFNAGADDIHMMKLLVHENYPSLHLDDDFQSVITQSELFSVLDTFDSHRSHALTALSVSCFVNGTVALHSARVRPDRKLRFPAYFKLLSKTRNKKRAFDVDKDVGIGAVKPLKNKKTHVVK